MPSPVPDAAEEHAGGAPERSELADDEPTSGPVDDLLEQVADTRATELDATRGDDPPGRSGAPTPDTGPDAPSEGSPVFRADESLADRLRREIADLSDTEREMLCKYREYGPATPGRSTPPPAGRAAGPTPTPQTGASGSAGWSNTPPAGDTTTRCRRSSSRSRSTRWRPMSASPTPNGTASSGPSRPSSSTTSRRRPKRGRTTRRPPGRTPHSDCRDRSPARPAAVGRPIRQ